MPEPVSEVTVRRQSSMQRMQQRKVSRKRRRLMKFRRPKRQTAAQKASVRKRKSAGFYKKVAKLRSSLDLPATITGSISHRDEYIDLILEVASGFKDEQQSAREFAKLFTDKDPAFSNTDTGMAAILFEAYVMEKGEDIVEQFLETQLEGADTTFLAIFQGQIKPEYSTKLEKGVAEFCLMDKLVNAGDTDHDSGSVSDFTIFECTPKRGAASKAGKETKTEPKMRTEGLLPKSKADYEAVVEEGGVSDNAFMYLFPNMWEAAHKERHNGDMLRARDKQGAMWYCNEGLWLPDPKSIEERATDEGKGKKYEIGDRVQIVRRFGFKKGGAATTIKPPVKGKVVLAQTGARGQELTVEINPKDRPRATVGTAKATHHRILVNAKEVEPLKEDIEEATLATFPDETRANRFAREIRSHARTVRPAGKQVYYEARDTDHTQETSHTDAIKEKCNAHGGKRKKTKKGKYPVKEDEDDHNIVAGPYVGTDVDDLIHPGEALCVGFEKALQGGPLYLENEEGFRSKFLAWTVRKEGTDDGKTLVHVGDSAFTLPVSLQEVKGLLDKMEEFYEDLPHEFDVMVQAFLREYCEEKGTELCHEDVVSRGVNEVLETERSHEFIATRDAAIAVACKMRKLALEGRGEGMGRGGARQGDGGATTCVCPKCGARAPHTKGKPCAEDACPKCGAKMVGESRDSMSLHEGFSKDTDGMFDAIVAAGMKDPGVAALAKLVDKPATKANYEAFKKGIRRVKDAKARAGLNKVVKAIDAGKYKGEFRQQFGGKPGGTKVSLTSELFDQIRQAAHYNESVEEAEIEIVSGADMQHGDGDDAHLFVDGEDMGHIGEATIEELTTSAMVGGFKLGGFKIGEKATTKTVKCPGCGGKVLAATGYCVKCKKKTVTEAKTYWGREWKSPKGEWKLSKSRFNDYTFTDPKGKRHLLRPDKMDAFIKKHKLTVAESVDEFTSPTKLWLVQPGKGDSMKLTPFKKASKAGDALNALKKKGVKGVGLVSAKSVGDAHRKAKAKDYVAEDDMKFAIDKEAAASTTRHDEVNEAALASLKVMAKDGKGKLKVSGKTATITLPNEKEAGAFMRTFRMEYPNLKADRNGTVIRVNLTEALDEAKVYFVVTAIKDGQKISQSTTKAEAHKTAKKQGGKVVLATSAKDAAKRATKGEYVLESDLDEALKVVMIGSGEKKGNIGYAVQDGKTRLAVAQVTPKGKVVAELDYVSRSIKDAKGKAIRAALTKAGFNVSSVKESVVEAKYNPKYRYHYVSKSEWKDAAKSAKGGKGAERSMLRYEKGKGTVSVPVIVVPDGDKRIGKKVLGRDIKESFDEGGLEDGEWTISEDFTEAREGEFLDEALRLKTSRDIEKAAAFRVKVHAGSKAESNKFRSALRKTSAGQAKSIIYEYSGSPTRVQFVLVGLMPDAKNVASWLKTGAGLQTNFEFVDEDYEIETLKDDALEEARAGAISATFPGVGKVTEPTHMQALARKAGKGKKKALALWAKAQAAINKQYPKIKAAKDEGGAKAGRYYKLVTAVFKNMLGLGKEECADTGPIMAEVHCAHCDSSTVAFLNLSTVATCAECGSDVVTPTGEVRPATEEEIEASDPALDESKKKAPHIGVQPRDYTSKQKTDVLKWLTTLTEKDLRRRQRINSAQSKIAYGKMKKHPKFADIQRGKLHTSDSDAYENLDTMSDLLTRAIADVAFR